MSSLARRIEKDANVFVVGAFGFRGFTYGPIIGDHIQAEMCFVKMKSSAVSFLDISSIK